MKMSDPSFVSNWKNTFVRSLTCVRAPDVAFSKGSTSPMASSSASAIRDSWVSAMIHS